MTHILKSNNLEAAIDLPSENYKGSRFDWSGKISSVKFKSLPLTTIEDTESKDVNFLGKEGTGGRGGETKSVGHVPRGGSLQDLSLDLNLDKNTASKLRILSEAKSRAVATEDYLTAKQIKSVEEELKTLGAQLAQLDVAKRQAVNSEDYDRAKMLKDEIDISRGDMLVKANDLPQQSQGITATLVWMNQQALSTQTNKEYEYPEFSGC